jgi:adenylate kinase family enzyme
VDRIVVLGRGGAGKSTLCRRISQAGGHTFICLDEIWRPEWTANDVPAFRTELKEAHEAERWVSDGCYAAATFDLRLPLATLVLWVEAPKAVCSWRALKRTFEPGEHHRFGGLLKVLRFVWRFDCINRPRIESLLEIHGSEVPVRVVKTSREADDFVREAALQGSAKGLQQKKWASPPS